MVETIVSVMKPGQKSCILDVDRDTLTCKENDGSLKTYAMSDISLLSKESRSIKDRNISSIINIGKRCFDKGECKLPVNVSVFHLDSCPACKAHAKVLDHVEKMIANSRMPITITRKDARKNLDEFKDIGCNGTPCVSLSVGNSKPVKIYEGMRGEIGILSDLFGVPNPLYYDVNLKNAKPTRLMKP